MKTRPVRNMVPLVLLTLVVAGCRSLKPREPSGDTIRPVVAVSSFENRSSFTGQWKLGTGMADLLVSQLFRCDHFTVVERRKLDRVVDELKLQKNPHFRTEGRAKSGRLMNARYLVRGVINDFDQIGGGSFWFAVKNVLMGGRAYRARVALTLTIVDVESGVIIDSVQAAGIARAREAYGKGKYKNVTFGGDAFFKTPLGVATARAMRSALDEIITHMPRQHWRPMVASVTDQGSIVLNGGAARKLRTGTRFDVRGPGQPVVDPITGDTLAILPGPHVGRIEIVKVEQTIAFAKPVSGSGFARNQHLVPIK